MPARWVEKLASVPVGVLHGVLLSLVMVGSTLIHLAIVAFDLDG